MSSPEDPNFEYFKRGHSIDEGLLKLEKYIIVILQIVLIDQVRSVASCFGISLVLHLIKASGASLTSARFRIISD